MYLDKLLVLGVKMNNWSSRISLTRSRTHDLIARAEGVGLEEVWNVLVNLTFDWASPDVEGFIAISEKKISCNICITEM